jgi:peptide deformylase
MASSNGLGLAASQIDAKVKVPSKLLALKLHVQSLNQTQIRGPVGLIGINAPQGNI